MNRSWLIAGCFFFIFGSCYAKSTRTKFGVSAYSRINMVITYLSFSFIKATRRVLTWKPDEALSLWAMGANIYFTLTL